MNALTQPFIVDDDTPQGFTFDQLPEKAKSRARQAYLESDPYDYDWWDFTYADAITIAEMMGITINTTEQKTMGGKSYQRPSLYFSGFSCQGDGACFEGYWSPVDHPGQMVRKIRAYARQDRKLHKIALVLAKASRFADHFEGFHTLITHRSNYYYSRSVDIETEIEMPQGYDDWPEFRRLAFNAIVGDAGERIESDIKDALIAFMDWIYHRLEAEWWAMHEDDYVDEYLSDRDTLFDEDGHEI